MINFNELLAKDLAEYLCNNEKWFFALDQGGEVYIDQYNLHEAISSYFKQHEDPVPALLRKK